VARKALSVRFAKGPGGTGDSNTVIGCIAASWITKPPSGGLHVLMMIIGNSIRAYRLVLLFWMPRAVNDIDRIPTR
jgi:hypothetical protein